MDQPEFILMAMMTYQQAEAVHEVQLETMCKVHLLTPVDGDVQALQTSLAADMLRKDAEAEALRIQAVAKDAKITLLQQQMTHLQESSSVSKVGHAHFSKATKVGYLSSASFIFCCIVRHACCMFAFAGSLQMLTVLSQMCHLCQPMAQACASLWHKLVLMMLQVFAGTQYGVGYFFHHGT